MISNFPLPTHRLCAYRKFFRLLLFILKSKFRPNLAIFSDWRYKVYNIQLELLQLNIISTYYWLDI